MKRGTFPKFKIVIPESNTTVLQLKKAIKRHYDLSQRRLVKQRNKLAKRDKIKYTTSLQLHAEGRSSKHENTHQSSDDDSNNDQDDNNSHSIQCNNISWRYIWRTYLLDFHGTRLTDDNQLVNAYGIGNKSVLKFVKKKTKQSR